MVNAYSYICMACNAAKGREYYQRNADKAAAMQRARLKSPRGAKLAREYRSKFYAENRDRWSGYRKTQKDKENASAWHRAGRMLSWIRARAGRAGFEFDLTREWIEQRLDAGVCEVSGLGLELGRDPKMRFVPFGPSVDRIDSSRGYTQDNCRVVVWIYNMAKSEWDDETVLKFAKALVANRP